ncbi:MAG: phosphoribosylamine--glycine ligase, partial [Bdellovibrionales bacterium]|nr:phosphoribosylamine--glycine ligase [Bdellovibrionales bacterium]
MKVLVVGGGGREHALAWKIGLSPRVQEVFLAPGNAGALLEAKSRAAGVAANDYPGILRFCRERGVDLAVIGPDQALADGLVDLLIEAGVATFGPRKDAARLEYSKAFAKEMMAIAGVPTARFEVFSDLAPALSFLAQDPWKDGYVVKADGLALGKGVVVCSSRSEAERELRDFLQEGKMGEAGKRVVLEERLAGPEVSAFHFCDGEEFRLLGFSCDYKRLLDGGHGPNTGGMGTYSPADWVPPGLKKTVDEEVVRPLLREMKRRGTPYSGVLFTGLMVTGDGPKVLEFNARFGDPETQSLLPMMK